MTTFARPYMFQPHRQLGRLKQCVLGAAFQDVRHAKLRESIQIIQLWWQATHGAQVANLNNWKCLGKLYEVTIT